MATLGVRATSGHFPPFPSAAQQVANVRFDYDEGLGEAQVYSVPSGSFVIPVLKVIMFCFVFVFCFLFSVKKHEGLVLSKFWCFFHCMLTLAVYIMEFLECHDGLGFEKRLFLKSY